jgi:addiction module RelB/DinJ family antitoxin
MNMTVISVKVEKKIKEQAMEVAKSTGISLSSLINAYLRQIVVTRRIEIYAPEPMTPTVEKIIAAAEQEIAAGDVVGFDSVEEFIADLKK